MAFLFSEKEREVIKKHIPWTRIVKDGKTDYKGEEIDLISFLRENKDRLVIKPNSEYGGRGVVVGVDADEKAWEDKIEEALSKPNVVQEYVPIPVIEFPCFRAGT